MCLCVRSFFKGREIQEGEIRKGSALVSWARAWTSHVFSVPSVRPGPGLPVGVPVAGPSTSLSGALRRGRRDTGDGRGYGDMCPSCFAPVCGSFQACGLWSIARVSLFARHYGFKVCPSRVGTCVLVRSVDACFLSCSEPWPDALIRALAHGRLHPLLEVPASSAWRPLCRTSLCDPDYVDMACVVLVGFSFYKQSRASFQACRSLDFLRAGHLWKGPFPLDFLEPCAGHAAACPITFCRASLMGVLCFKWSFCVLLRSRSPPGMLF